MEEIKTPMIDGLIGKLVSQEKRAYTIYKNKHMELIEAQKAKESLEVLKQIAHERQRQAIRLMKAQNNTANFIRGLSELLVWEK